MTAVALAGPDPDRCDVRLAEVLVTMKSLNEAALATTICEPARARQKPAPYSIQGAGQPSSSGLRAFTAAMGLPLRLVVEMLQQCGLSCPVDIEQLYAGRPYPNWDRFRVSRGSSSSHIPMCARLKWSSQSFTMRLVQ